MTTQAKIHELKTWPRQFMALCVGIKTFEIRRNDRNFAVGDILKLRCYDPKAEKYTWDIDPIFARITYILDGGSFGLMYGYVVLAISKIEGAGGG